jgi:hypothetical protein
MLISSGVPSDKPWRVWFVTYEAYALYQITDMTSPQPSLRENWITKGVYGFGRPVSWSEMMEYRATKKPPAGFVFPRLPWSQLSYLKVGEVERIESGVSYAPPKDWRDTTYDQG